MAQIQAGFGVTKLSPEDRLAIEAVQTAWLDAELRHDTSALLALCTEAPVWLPPGEDPLCGRAAILAWLERQPPVAMRRIHLEDLSIVGTGAFAWKQAAFRTTLTGRDGTDGETVDGVHGWLLQRDDPGAWRVAVATWTVE